MTGDRSRAALEEIVRIATEALKNIGGAPVGAKVRAAARSPRRARKSEPSGLPAHILQLRNTGFFKIPKTDDEVHAKLQPIYSCDLNRVAVALTRLRGRKVLRKLNKRVGEKEKVASVW